MKTKTKAAKAAAKNAPDWQYDNCICELIRTEIGTDNDYAGDADIAEFYLQLDDGQRAAVDVALIKICGWSLETLISAAKQKLPPGEVETGKGNNPYITLMKSAEKEWLTKAAGPDGHRTTRVAVTCFHCKRTDEIQMTPEALASWFSEGKTISPDATDERIWEILKSSAVCPDCAEEHPPSPGSHRIGCPCGKCGID